MAADKTLQLINGLFTEVVATVTSQGAASNGDIVALDETGRITVSVLPVGVGPDVRSITASEAIGAGKYVNIYNNAGTENIRLADNSNNRPAHGYMKESVVLGAVGIVYFEGPNSALSGLTPGARQYLGTAGGVTATPPAFPAAVISQFLGIAVGIAEINTDIDDQVVLA